MMTREQAIDMFRSDDLVAIGMEADAVRKRLHPEGVVSYIIDRNINYTNFCTEYCSFCAFYRPMGHREGYILPNDVILAKIQETVDLGGTGILMQGGLHPDLKIEWYEDLLRTIKSRFNVWCHCFSAPELVNIAEVSGLSLRDTIARLRRCLLDVMARHPLILAGYPFGIAMLIGMLHGPAPWMEAFKGLLAWRRMLLLPLALRPDSSLVLFPLQLLMFL